MPVLTPRSVYAPGREPPKLEVIQLLEQIMGSASAPAVVKQTKAALDAVTPTNENYGGLVLSDPDPAKNGYYSRAAGAWVKGRGFPDSFATLVSVGGSANAITAQTVAGVDPAEILCLILPNPPGTNATGAVTISLNGGAAEEVKAAAGGDLAAGDIVGGVGTLLFRFGAEWRQLFSSAVGAVFDHQGDWNGAATYTKGQVATGSNGNWYQLKVPTSLNDNPVSGGSGNWLMIMAATALVDGSVTTQKLGPNAVTREKLSANVRALLAIAPIDYGAIGDSVANDTVPVESSLADLQAGGTWDGMGLTYSVTSESLNVPANVTVRNAVFKLDGTNNQLMFDVKGARTVLTYGGGAIAAGATQLLSLSGITASDIGKALHVYSTSDHIGQTNFKRGELTFIKGVSGTTVTLSHQLQLAYTANIVVELVTMKPGVTFENVRFISTKGAGNVQAGLKLEACSHAKCEVYGENLGYYTVQRRLCYNHHVYGGGSNEAFTTDNGFDYFLVDAGGALLTAEVKGRAYRHVYVCGWEGSTQFATEVKVIGHACKDSACDAHPNVMDFTVDVQTYGVRQGGTFSSQPVGLMYQGGGILRARVDVDGYDTSAVVVQLLQNTDDQVDISVQGRKPSSAATRGIDFQVWKPAGKVSVLDATFNGEEMANAASRGISVDTVGSASGLVIESIVLKGSTPGKEAGKQVTCRNNHNIRSVVFSDLSFGQASGGYGTYAVAEAAAGIGRVLVNGHTNIGVAGSIGSRCTNVPTSVAAGTLTTGVGGASLTTNALVGFTKADVAANHYT